jgi:hypothetical protein
MRGAVDDLQDQVADISALLKFVDTGNVRMTEGGENLRFAPEAREPFRIGRKRRGE